MDKAATIRVGWPDFSIFWMSHCLFIEMKVGKGKPSKVQEKVIAEIRRSGNRVVVAYSLEECIKACQNILCVGKEIATAEPLHSGTALSEAKNATAAKGLARDRNKPLMGNGSERPRPTHTDSATLFIGSINGTQYVFRGDSTPGGECEKLRRATPADVINIR
jgi:hypothetical protein